MLWGQRGPLGSDGNVYRSGHTSHSRVLWKKLGEGHFLSDGSFSICRRGIREALTSTFPCLWSSELADPFTLAAGACPPDRDLLRLHPQWSSPPELLSKAFMLRHSFYLRSFFHPSWQTSQPISFILSSSFCSPSFPASLPCSLSPFHTFQTAGPRV